YPGAFRLDARSLHNQMADSNFVNGIMFSSFPAFQRCKVRPYATDIHGVPFCYESGFYPGTFRLDAGFLHNQTADSDSVNGTMFSSFRAFQRRKVCPYATDIHGVPFSYESGFYPGTFRLDAGFLHNQTANSDS